MLETFFQDERIPRNKVRDTIVALHYFPLCVWDTVTWEILCKRCSHNCRRKEFKLYYYASDYNLSKVCSKVIQIFLFPFCLRSLGWRIKHEKSKYWDVIRHQCEGYGENNTSRCVLDSTYELEDLLEDIWIENPRVPANRRPSIKNERFWISDFTLTWPGRCYTVNITKRKGYNQIHLFLNSSMAFKIFVHDPKYFLYSQNPQAIPLTTWIIPKQTRFFSLSVVETENQELNVPNDPCDDDIEYNFSACIKKSLSVKIGCRNIWNNWSSENFSTCSTLEDFRWNTSLNFAFFQSFMRQITF